MSINFNTTVDPNKHKIVVVICGSAFGFGSIAGAISFVEEAYATSEPVKLFNAIAIALSDDKEDDFQIFDIETYSDLFIDDEDEDA